MSQAWMMMLQNKAVCSRYEGHYREFQSEKWHVSRETVIRAIMGLSPQTDQLCGVHLREYLHGMKIITVILIRPHAAVLAS